MRIFRAGRCLHGFGDTSSISKPLTFICVTARGVLASDHLVEPNEMIRGNRIGNNSPRSMKFTERRETQEPLETATSQRPRLGASALMESIPIWGTSEDASVCIASHHLPLSQLREPRCNLAKLCPERPEFGDRIVEVESSQSFQLGRPRTYTFSVSVVAIQIACICFGRAFSEASCSFQRCPLGGGHCRRGQHCSYRGGSCSS